MDTEAIISAEPKMFSPRQTYLPSSDLEAFRIRRLPSGRIAILKIIKKGFFFPSFIASQLNDKSL